MIWLYDKAICDDLANSFVETSADGHPVVKIIDPESVVGLAAQIKNDAITYPIVAITRKTDISVNDSLTNFTKHQIGVPAVIDEETNNLYYEKALPINLSYALTVLTTNTIDMDEIVKELVFKYIEMYFLTITLPYESKRNIRFGVVMDGGIEQSSSTAEYLQAGKLHQSIINLRCEGAVLISYAPMHLKRIAHEITPIVRPKFEHKNLI